MYALPLGPGGLLLSLADGKSDSRQSKNFHRYEMEFQYDAREEAITISCRNLCALDGSDRRFWVHYRICDGNVVVLDPRAPEAAVDPGAVGRTAREGAVPGGEG
jgi:hypothetical protein